MRQTALLNEKSERYQEWLDVFGANVIPITNALAPARVSVLGVMREVYFLDLRAITPLQRSRLLQHLAVKFSIPTREIASTIDEIGVPILANDVTASIDRRLLM